MREKNLDREEHFITNTQKSALNSIGLCNKCTVQTHTHTQTNKIHAVKLTVVPRFNCRFARAVFIYANNKFYDSHLMVCFYFSLFVSSMIYDFATMCTQCTVHNVCVSLM